ncbi:hypothetical protein HELRODRAFT_182750 [Helobdella robusta]|uniref:Protein kinase domain-containing protein n=1 Tax=Helobdella robusta TaxID=6412 RepID=T1FIP1_HELRO|nr:hypothetical protein HELRODRAFT_182750 [Helobdella robusta]ESN90147.1 hypothetical protein HELRODRAFT_182750 [Helobdella robusta]
MTSGGCCSDIWQVISLVKGMLTIDPATRWTADKVSKLKWIPELSEHLDDEEATKNRWQRCFDIFTDYSEFADSLSTFSQMQQIQQKHQNSVIFDEKKPPKKEFHIPSRNVLKKY